MPRRNETKQTNSDFGASLGARHLLLKDELARCLRVTSRTVENREREGLPSVRIGRAVRYDLDEVLAWLRDRIAPDQIPQTRNKKAERTKPRPVHRKARR